MGFSPLMDVTAKGDRVVRVHANLTCNDWQNQVRSTALCCKNQVRSTALCCKNRISSNCGPRRMLLQLELVTVVCVSATDLQAFAQMGNIDIYDAFSDVCSPSASESATAQSRLALPRINTADSNSNAGCAIEYDPCIDDKTAIYLNTPAVQVQYGGARECSCCSVAEHSPNPCGHGLAACHQRCEPIAHPLREVGLLL